MITALSWIPKGASKAMPDAAESPSMEKIKELIHIGTFKKSLTDMDVEEELDDEIQNSEVTHTKSVAKSFGKPCSKSKDASSSSTDADDVVKFLKELDMDNYDEEDDEIELWAGRPLLSKQ